MATYFVYINEDTGRRAVVEVPADLAPIHIANEGGIWERVGGPLDASSIEEAFAKAIGGEAVEVA